MEDWSPRADGFGGPKAQIGRQAIFDRNFHVLGYDLTYRSLDSKLKGDTAASDLILNAFAELGLERVVGRKLAFMPIPYSAIVGDLPLPVPPDRVVLQIDMQVASEDAAYFAAVRQRAEEGFRLALDNYSYRPEMVPLIQLARYQKIGLQTARAVNLKQLVNQAREFNAQLIVKDVEAHEDVDFCSEAGVAALQGRFLYQPQIVEQRRAPRNFAVLAELLSRLKEPRVSFIDVEEIVKKDAGLSVTLLRFLNSAGFGLRAQVSTIRQAVALLGLNEFTKWVTLMAMASGSDKPSELLATALIRAKTCELLARTVERGNTGNSAFIVGLFSLLDALLDQSMEKILSELPIADSIRSALLDGAGLEGEMLSMVLDYERGVLPDDGVISPVTVSDAWLYSVEWVEGVRGMFA